MKHRHLLVIDDEDDIREVVTISLEAIGGWRVSNAGGGAEGITRARSDRPDAILLDVMMPGIDGPATLQRLQADPRTRDIPVIFLTAKTQGADRSRFAMFSAAGTITKPFDPMTLTDQIAAILERSDNPS